MSGKNQEARPTTIADFYGGGELGNLLKPQYQTDAVYRWFQKRHEKHVGVVIGEDGWYRRNGHEWKIPYGVRIAAQQPLIFSQITFQHPFYVTWISPKTGKRVKRFMQSLSSSIVFIAEKVQYVDENAAIISRHGYHMPPKLRGKFPRKMGGRLHYWCPRCMAPRVFKLAPYRGTFYAQKKVWNDEKGKYVFTDRKLAVIECSFCGVSNRDHKFRAANQPWEVRKFKQGVRKARRRR
jgi:hypothetical protein